MKLQTETRWLNYFGSPCMWTFILWCCSLKKKQKAREAKKKKVAAKPNTDDGIEFFASCDLKCYVTYHHIMDRSCVCVCLSSPLVPLCCMVTVPNPGIWLHGP